MSQQKRKRVSLTIQQKLDILKKLEEGVKIRKIAAEYNLGNSTVHDIKKNKDKLVKFSSSMANSLVSYNQRHTMKESPFAILDKAVLHWFNEERTNDNLITGPMIAQRAKELFVTMGMEGTFDASSGWLSRFKERYGIRTVGNSLDCVWTRTDMEFDANTGKVLLNEDSTSVEDAYVLNSVVASENSDSNENRIGEQNINESVSQKQKTHTPMDKFEITNETSNEMEIITEAVEEVDEGCVCNNLKSIVKKLHSLSEKLAATTYCDSFDDFSRYISSLLRGLPKKKALQLKSKLVNDIIEALSAHERGVLYPKTTEKKRTNKLFNKKVTNYDASLPTDIDSSDVMAPSQNTTPPSSTTLHHYPIKISPQAVINGPFDQISGFSASSTVTQCESVRTVSPTATETLLAVTLPYRGSQVVASSSKDPQPPDPMGGKTRGIKRKQDFDKCPVKKLERNERDLNIGFEFSKDHIKHDQEVLNGGINFVEFSKDHIKHDQEVLNGGINFVEVKEEPLDLQEEDKEESDLTQFFLCDICLIHCPSMGELDQHFTQEHPGCVPTYKDREGDT